MISILLSSLVLTVSAWSSGAPCVEDVYLTQTPGHGIEVDNFGLYELAVKQLDDDLFKVRITATNYLAGLILMAAQPDLESLNSKRNSEGSFEKGNDKDMEKFCLRFMKNECEGIVSESIITHAYSNCPWRSAEHQCSRFTPCIIDLIWTKPSNVSADGLRFYLTAVPGRSIYFRAKSVVFLNEVVRSDDLSHQLKLTADAQVTTPFLVHKTYPTYPPPLHLRNPSINKEQHESEKRDNQPISLQ